MSLEEFINERLTERRDVTFPVHVDDSPATFVPFGFRDTGPGFSPRWEMSFAADARLTAAFTGLLFVHHDTAADEYFLDLAIASSRPIRPISWYPGWYPIPAFARYGPFTQAEILSVANLALTEDRSELSALHAPSSDASRIDQRLARNESRYRVVARALAVDAPGEDDSRANIGALFAADRLPSGIPVAAGDILIKRRAGDDFFFSLHPEKAGSDPGIIELEDALFMDPSRYFSHWQRLIEDWDRYPDHFRQRSIAPPLTSGRFHLVRQTPDPSITLPQHPTVEAAFEAAAEHDVILILDKATYRVRTALGKYVSILGLVPRDDDVRAHEDLDETALAARLAGRYPTLQGPSRGMRGLIIQYRNGALSRTSRNESTGIIFLSGVSISGNELDVTAEAEPGSPRLGLGGAGALIDGRYYDGAPGEVAPLGSGFSAVHLDNCAICSNTMTSAHVEAPMQGGGVMTAHASPVISRCLIKYNLSQFQGGGIGIYNYSYPRILENVIRSNFARGWPGDLPHGGDGGGVGVFQALPDPAERRRLDAIVDAPLDDPVASAEAITDATETLNRLFPEDDLQDARTYWVVLQGNMIRGNRSALSGGGVYGTVCAQLRLADNTIRGNEAIGERGGGVGVTYGSRLRITGGTITENRSLQNGAGIYIRSSKAEIENCEIRSNTTPESGGAISVESRAEISGPGGHASFDLILANVFTHIDKVELVLRNVRIPLNTAAHFASVHGIKDERGYQDLERRLWMTVGLLRILPLRVDIDTASSISPAAQAERFDGDGARTVHPVTAGTPFEI